MSFFRLSHKKLCSLPIDSILIDIFSLKEASRFHCIWEAAADSR